MRILLALTLVVAVYGDCPNFGPMREWSECLWAQNSEGKLSTLSMKAGFMDACGVSVEGGSPPADVPVSMDFPDKCGHCAFKVRCQNRQPTDGCFAVKAEKEVCNEFPDVCVTPRTPMFNNCEWGFFHGIMGQCTTGRPDMPTWKREGFLQGNKLFPEMNCIKKETNQCACCCHPYKPNADGTACVAAPPKPECNDFGEWKEWTECLWYPLDSMVGKVKAHCAAGDQKPMPKPPGSAAAVKKLFPKGFEIPEKCGFCSFKMRCRNRDAAGKPGCFGVETDKVACGPDDCESCGDICTLPKLPEGAGNDRCSWHKKLAKLLKAKAGGYMKKMKSYWRKRSFKQIARQLPTGSCKEVGDHCKCCCHPYEPNDAGTECVLKDMCKIATDNGGTLTVDSD